MISLPRAAPAQPPRWAAFTVIGPRALYRLSISMMILMRFQAIGRDTFQRHSAKLRGRAFRRAYFPIFVLAILRYRHMKAALAFLA